MNEKFSSGTKKNPNKQILAANFALVVFRRLADTKTKTCLESLKQYTINQKSYKQTLTN